MDTRLKQIYAKLKKVSLDALIISSPYNITYLTRHRSRDSYLVVTKDKNIYFTDSRYIEEVKSCLAGFSLKKINGSVPDIIARACIRLRLKRIGFEAKHISFKQYEELRKKLNKYAGLVPTHGFVEESRQIKTTDELAKIKQAAEITIKAFGFIKKFIAPGQTELQIAGELERFIRYNGAYTSGFAIIVASGPNSSFPHHITSHRKIKDNEPVLIDLGVDYEGYKSDLTRIFFLGKIKPIIRKVYAIVRTAQDRAIKEVKPGVVINKIDRAARQYITQRGYGGFFSHSLGHGIGLEVHEYPNISQKEKNKLKPGMVFTVEPAIYLPHRFGIRIEDTVIVTKKGCEVLSGALDK